RDAASAHDDASAAGAGSSRPRRGDPLGGAHLRISDAHSLSSHGTAARSETRRAAQHRAVPHPARGADQRDAPCRGRSRPHRHHAAPRRRPDEGRGQRPGDHGGADCEPENDGVARDARARARLRGRRARRPGASRGHARARHPAGRGRPPCASAHAGDPHVRRVLLVDDHPVVRQGIRRVLAEGLPDVMIGEADTGPAALAKMEDGAWDAVLLDLTLRGPDGLEVLRTLHTTYPSVPVLIVSMHPAEQFAHRAITAGAAGYLTKDADPGALLKIVAGVLKGKRYPAEAADPDDLTAAARA